MVYISYVFYDLDIWEQVTDIIKFTSTKTNINGSSCYKMKKFITLMDMIFFVLHFRVVMMDKRPIGKFYLKWKRNILLEELENIIIQKDLYGNKIYILILKLLNLKKKLMQ